ncbi:MAG TPA: ATP-binding protein [Syntrophorhabdaceae bacterium]|nr:Sensor kinase CckA [Syntrophorhabdaceae bacterium]MDI9561804.1 ATP-binding protein [Pseudomonadota bacterium]HOS60297.1 ATP-binding protein [Syntrophorhabdaceae bacterium]
MNNILYAKNIVNNKADHILSINEITSYLVHDINNILQTIVGSAEILIMTNQNNALAHSKACAIKTSSLSAVRLMKYILDLNYKKSFEKRKMYINDCITNMQDILDKLCGNRITITYELKELLAPVVAIDLYIEEILLNLTINARDAINTEGLIKIATGEKVLESAKKIPAFGQVSAGNYSYISVNDNGCGIPQDILDKIHKPAFTTKKNGNGIGLHIVYTIAKELSGFVTVKSAESVGSTITVYIPQAADVVAPPCSCA